MQHTLLADTTIQGNILEQLESAKPGEGKGGYKCGGRENLGGSEGVGVRGWGHRLGRRGG